MDRAVIYIANAKFIDMEIENFSEREKIAFFSKLYLAPNGDTDNIDALLNSLRQYFKSVESLSSEPQRIHMKACSYKGIEIDILVYVKTTNFDVYLDEINQLNLTILQCLKSIIVSYKSLLFQRNAN